MHESYSLWLATTRRILGLATAFTVALALLAAPPASADDVVVVESQGTVREDVTTPDEPDSAPATREGGADAFAFAGGGFGHSVGMSQFGAFGMAREGADWVAILEHYFTDSTVAPLDPGLAEHPLWVNLQQERTSTTLTVVATEAAPAGGVSVTLGEQQLVAEQGDQIRISMPTSETCQATVGEDSIAGPCEIDLNWDGFSGQPGTALRLDGCSLADWNDPRGTTLKPCTYARGGIRVRPDNTPGSYNLVLEISIDDYILGISESPYYWGDRGGMDALRAQAVAARSYAVHRALSRGNPADRAWCYCHIYDTSIDQHYVGWGHGQPAWVEAVADTSLQVMVHPQVNRHGGAQMPIETFYSSSTFGMTENSEHGFTAYVPYLRSVDDRWSQLPGLGNSSARWIKSFTSAELAARLPGLSTVTGFEITKCSTTGAALEVTFTGEGGPKTFTTRELRGKLSLKSMQVFDIGVGEPSGTPPCMDPKPDPEPEPDPKPDPEPEPEPKPEPKPEHPAVEAAGIELDDDAIGDSIGDGDGLMECGETIEVFTGFRNTGDVTLTGIKAEIRIADPALGVRWNTTSEVPDIAPGATAANAGDWDLTISPKALNGHVAAISVKLMTDQGHWSVHYEIPLHCSEVEVSGLSVIDDLNDNGSDEVVLVVKEGRGRTDLLVKDGATGETISQTKVAGPAWDVVSVVAGPDVVGADNGDIAVLLHRARDGRGRMIVVDPATGTRSKKHGFATKFKVLDVEVVGDTGGSPAPDAVILAVAADGRSRVYLRDMRTGEKLNMVPVMQKYRLSDAVVVPNLGGSKSADVGLVANVGGRLKLLFRDPVSKDRFPTLTLGKDLEAIAATVVDGKVTVAASDGSKTMLLIADPQARTVERIGLGKLRAADLSALSGGRDRVVLTGNRGGSDRVIVIDVGTGDTLVDEAAGGGPTRGLRGVDRGSIASVEGGQIVVRDGLTGRVITTFPAS